MGSLNAWRVIAQSALDGLVLGSSYALLAIGFTLIFGVLRRMNLAYGATIMLGLYVANWIRLNSSLSVLFLLPLAVVFAVLAGVYVERLCVAPHSGRGPLTGTVATFAIWMQLEELATHLLPRHSYPFPSPFEIGMSWVGSLSLRLEGLISLFCGAVVSIGLWYLLYRTRFGLAVRAMTDSPQAATSVGVNTGRISLSIFALASAIGGIAGYQVVSVQEQITPMFAMWATLKGMVAAMLGGLGSLPGAILGGVIMGIFEMQTQVLVGPQFRDLTSYGLLFFVLLLFPNGLSTFWKQRQSAV